MQHYKKRSCIIIMVLVSILMSLFIPNTSFSNPPLTVYAEDADYPVPSGELSKGDCSDEVKWLQNALNIILNADLSVDGDFGEGTENALKELQGQHGIDQTGTANEPTVELIKMLLAESENALSDGETPEEETVEKSVDESLDDLKKAILDKDSGNEENAPDFKAEDPRNVPPKEEGHLFSGYWKEYFATLKSLISKPKATLAPFKKTTKIIFVLCAALALFALHASLPIVPVQEFGMFTGEFDSLGDSGCFGAMLKFLGVIFLLSPLSNDVNYIMLYSDTGLIGAVLLGIIFTALRLALGLIVGGLILYAIFVVFSKISEDAAVIIGLIPGGAVLLLFYFTPSVMGAWLPTT